MAQSKIEWTEMTWNPTTGCSKISKGCKHCYAETMSKRLQSMGNPKYKNGFDITLHPETLRIPYSWKKPRIVFVNSMSDLFHEDIPFDYIQKVFQVMNDNRQHIFQVLTKRSEQLSKLHSRLDWRLNIWMGVTVESKEYEYRIDLLRETGASVKFLSIEPMIGPTPALNLSGIDWVIVGGESGFGARPINKGWVEDVNKQCKEVNVPFFFKQWGGIKKNKNGRLLNGKTYDGMPKIELYEHPTFQFV
ncbi:MAG: phage Gp37/Gp68 family protein [Bacteroidetes bacterium]|nr:phage Gp37/Gp68 family protein [Bacteroidota bacterium]